MQPLKSVEKSIRHVARGLITHDECCSHVAGVLSQALERARQLDWECVDLAKTTEQIEANRTEARRLRQEVPQGWRLLIRFLAREAPKKINFRQLIAGLYAGDGLYSVLADGMQEPDVHLLCEFAAWHEQRRLTDTGNTLPRLLHNCPLQPGVRVRLLFGLNHFDSTEGSSCEEVSSLMGTFVGFAACHPDQLITAFVELDEPFPMQPEVDRNGIEQPGRSSQCAVLVGTHFVDWNQVGDGGDWHVPAQMRATVHIFETFPSTFNEYQNLLPDRPCFRPTISNVGYEVADSADGRSRSTIVEAAISIARELLEFHRLMKLQPMDTEPVKAVLLRLKTLLDEQPSLRFLVYPALMVGMQMHVSNHRHS